MRRQPIVDPILVWWRSRGPVTVLRLPDTAEVVHHHVSEEDEHVRRYMVALEGRFDNTWQVLQGSHWSYDSVMVPPPWVSTARPIPVGRYSSSCTSDAIYMYDSIRGVLVIIFDDVRTPKMIYFCLLNAC